MDHDFSVDMPGQAATCTEAGWTAYKKCSRCEEIKGKDVIPALDHDFSVDVAGQAATCTEDGWTAYKKCSRCEETKGKTTITATGHDWKAVKWTWAEDYSSATVELECQNNTEHKKTITVTPEQKVVKEATCETNRIVTYTATAEYEGQPFTDTKENIEVAGTATSDHAWTFTEVTWAESTEGGYAATAHFKCANSETHTTEAKMTVSSETTEATCQAAGKTVYTASLAATDSPDKKEHKDEKTVTIEKLGHNWGEWTVTREATEEQEGVKERACSRCKATEQAPIPRLEPTPGGEGDGTGDDNTGTQGEGTGDGPTIPEEVLNKFKVTVVPYGGISYAGSKINASQIGGQKGKASEKVLAVKITLNKKAARTKANALKGKKLKKATVKTRTGKKLYVSKLKKTDFSKAKIKKLKKAFASSGKANTLKELNDLNKKLIQGGIAQKSVKFKKITVSK